MKSKLLAARVAISIFAAPSPQPPRSASPAEAIRAWRWATSRSRMPLRRFSSFLMKAKLSCWTAAALEAPVHTEGPDDTGCPCTARPVAYRVAGGPGWVSAVTTRMPMRARI
jgi:hypothetical protein